MNLATKPIILDTEIFTLITLVGGGSFYSFLFFFVILFLPAISVFVSFDITVNSLLLFLKSGDESQLYVNGTYLSNLFLVSI